MAIKSNGLLKWLMIPAVVVAVFIGIKVFSGSNDKIKTPRAVSVGDSTLTPAEMKALGVDADTPRDTLATLVAQLKGLRQELKTAVTDNKQLKTENERLRQRENSIDQRIQTALDTERSRSQQERAQAASEQQQTQSVLQDLQRRLDGLRTARDHADLPVGLGLEDGDAVTSDGPVQWTEPQDVIPQTQKGKPSPSRSLPPRDDPVSPFGAESAGDESATPVAAAETPSGNRTRTQATAESASITPTYTVPSNATLIGSVAMTALIGRIPIDGTVNDPYPFKVIIGSENLTANGIEIPDVVGAVASGSASGDWNLSCVRGQIRSLTFVFQDGTVRTMTSSGSRENSIQEGLGWISDPYGVPCVTGEKHSNGKEYLTSQMLITAAGAGAASLIPKGASNYSYISGSNGNTLGTVGISGQEAMGRVLGGGVQEMSQWVNKLYGQAFAAIYVPPGAPVAVHIEQPLTIDYDSQGRRVNYRLGESHALDLD